MSKLQRINSSFYVLGNRRSKYKKMNSPGEILSVLRRVAKPTSFVARIGFYLLKILFTFLGPWMLTLPSPSQNNNPLVPGESGSYRPVPGFQPHSGSQSHMQTLPMVSSGTRAGPSTTAAHQGGYTTQSLFQCFTLETQVGYKGQYPAANLLQSLLRSPGFSLYSPSKLIQGCSFTIMLN